MQAAFNRRTLLRVATAGTASLWWQAGAAAAAASAPNTDTAGTLTSLLSPYAASPAEARSAAAAEVTGVGGTEGRQFLSELTSRVAADPQFSATDWSDAEIARKRLVSWWSPWVDTIEPIDFQAFNERASHARQGVAEGSVVLGDDLRVKTSAPDRPVEQIEVSSAQAHRNRMLEAVDGIALAAMRAGRLAPSGGVAAWLGDAV